MELGVPARFIAGRQCPAVKTTVEHRQLGQYWYNLDTTWNDQATRQRIFFRNNAAFSDTSGSTNIKPTRSTPHTPCHRPIQQRRRCPDRRLPEGRRIIRRGDVFTLMQPSRRPRRQQGAYLVILDRLWRLSQRGRRHRRQPGTAVITALAMDGSGALATFKVTRRWPTFQRWARTWWARSLPEVSSRQTGSGYKTNITRANLRAHHKCFEYAKGPYTPKNQPPFTILPARPSSQISKSLS
jgi:hypothetical protein